MEKERHYNWDDLEVGRFDLNHSENFFTQKHFKHEKIDGINLDYLNLADGMENKQSEKRVDNNNEYQPDKNKLIKSEDSGKAKMESKVTHNNLARLPLVNRNFAQPTASCSNQVPSVFKYKEIYEKKRQEILRRQLEDERKQRLFKSKPVPNFANDPKPRKQHVEITVPVTPLTLRHSKEALERRKRLIEEYKKKHQPQKFVGRNPHVLFAEPFIPHKPEQHVEPEPFNLHVEKRLQERKQYDTLIKRKMEEKQRQVFDEEHDKKKQEEQAIKEIRKQRTFKARPNPFK